MTVDCSALKLLFEPRDLGPETDFLRHDTDKSILEDPTLYLLGVDQ